MDSPLSTIPIHSGDKRLFEEKDNTMTQEKTVAEKAVFQHNSMKYLKTKVFYKLFLNTVHKNGDKTKVI